jgi:hypothetical protein
MFQSPMNVESASAVFRLGRRDADGTARWPIIKARAEPCFRLPISCFCAPAGLALYGKRLPERRLAPVMDAAAIWQGLHHRRSEPFEG